MDDVSFPASESERATYVHVDVRRQIVMVTRACKWEVKF
jgi:hypothetical protein